MPKKKSTGNRKTFGDLIVQLPMFEDGEKKVVGYIQDMTAFNENVTYWVEQGVSFNMAYNDQGEDFTCRVRMADPENVNDQKMFYCNAPTPIEAVGVALAKLNFYGIEGDWSQYGVVKRSRYS